MVKLEIIFKPFPVFKWSIVHVRRVPLFDNPAARERIIALRERIIALREDERYKELLRKKGK